MRPGIRQKWQNWSRVASTKYDRPSLGNQEKNVCVMKTHTRWLSKQTKQNKLMKEDEEKKQPAKNKKVSRS